MIYQEEFSIDKKVFLVFDGTSGNLHSEELR